MSTISRRSWIKANAALAAATTVTADVPVSVHAASKGNFQLSEIYNVRETERLQIAKQLGVTHAISNGPFRGIGRDQYTAAALKMRDDYAAAGFTVAGIEGHPVSFENVKFGTEGREEEILNTIAAIEALGKAGVPMICYNFMAGIGWFRTKQDVPERGDALTSEFDLEDSKKLGLTRWGEISEEKLWENLAYFLERIMPAAEKANVRMAMHPDDPPISPLRGIGRIITSAAAYRRVLKLVPSPMNGITFCQANFKAMGEDIYALAKEFGEQKKIFFVHFRDIEGTKEHFHETFHDNGPTDMPRILKIYSDTGFNGPIRPDHAPTLAGESGNSNGYGMNGKVFAFGYMIGIMQSLGLPYS